jgi:hypothetical protein
MKTNWCDIISKNTITLRQHWDFIFYLKFTNVGTIRTPFHQIRLANCTQRKLMLRHTSRCLNEIYPTEVTQTSFVNGRPTRNAKPLFKFDTSSTDAPLLPPVVLQMPYRWHCEITFLLPNSMRRYTQKCPFFGKFPTRKFPITTNAHWLLRNHYYIITLHHRSINPYEAT